MLPSFITASCIWLALLQIEQNAGGSVIKQWKPDEVRRTIVPRLSDDKEQEISLLVQNSHSGRREATLLLKRAKRAVEIAIERNAESLSEFLKDPAA